MKFHRNADPEESNRTIPWHQSEFCIVNGLPLVYRFSEMDTMKIVLPGGIHLTPRELVKRGASVKMPILTRRNTEDDL